METAEGYVRLLVMLLDSFSKRLNAIMKRGNDPNRFGFAIAHYALNQELGRARCCFALQLYRLHRTQTSQFFIDLHGCHRGTGVIVTQAAVVQAARERAASLKIVTGRGLHSVGGVSVLRREVQALLLSMARSGVVAGVQPLLGAFIVTLSRR